MSYSHLTIKDRYQIEAYVREGHSVRKIASLMKVHPSTISRELRRSPGQYSAEHAQEHASARFSTKGRPTLCTASVARNIEAKLKKTWSPEQIAHTLKGKVPCFKTIYNWIHDKRLSVDERVLRRKGRPFRTQEIRGKFLSGTPISQRPQEVELRNTFGHWEIDTVVAPRGKDKACVATFLERETRFYVAILIPDRSATSMLHAIKQLVKKYGKNCFQSITSDRGKEFGWFKEVEAMGIPFYFADPYSSWQRGSNENANGLLREFYPKGTMFSQVGQEELDRCISLINERPRKCLGFRTGLEMFTAEISNL